MLRNTNTKNYTKVYEHFHRLVKSEPITVSFYIKCFNTDGQNRTAANVCTVTDGLSSYLKCKYML